MDYYKTLGISKDASGSEIKKAYRKLSRENHPDLNKGDKEKEAKFKKISEAYDILSDSQKKSEYDQFGSTGNSGGFGGGGGGFGGFGGGDGVDIEDLFGSFFGGGNGGGRRKSGPQRGHDLETSIKLSFEDSVKGIEKELNLNKFESCGTCSGKGYKNYSDKETCKYCHGAGSISQIQRTPFGNMKVNQTCSHCSGEGESIKNKCGDCHGVGRIEKQGFIKIKIPAGIYDGASIKLSGKGEAGEKGGPSGDLFVNISVGNSKKFEREGDDINYNLQINFIQAILGTEVEIETIYGDLKLKIPGGTTHGKIFRVKNYGMSILNNLGKGDMFVKIEIEFPKKVSSKSKDLLLEIAKNENIKLNGSDLGKKFNIFS